MLHSVYVLQTFHRWCFIFKRFTLFINTVIKLSLGILRRFAVLSAYSKSLDQMREILLARIRYTYGFMLDCCVFMNIYIFESILFMKGAALPHGFHQVLVQHVTLSDDYWKKLRKSNGINKLREPSTNIPLCACVCSAWMAVCNVFDGRTQWPPSHTESTQRDGGE